MPVPAPLSSFVGREAELAALPALLGRVRLLTLVGPPGIGKTRLARELLDAAGLAGDAIWVDLAPIERGDLLAQALTAALGLRQDADESPVAMWRRHFGLRPALVVLDNCEHLIGPAAELVAALLGPCPGLRVLATSRARLGLAGEQAWTVEGLSLPAGDAPDAVAGAAAVRLFLERARAVQPAFVLSEANLAAVARICRRLDGVPLAIELAAARARAFGPESIAARLDDAFAVLGGASGVGVGRHRTLRAALDWSHALLTDQERLLLDRLAVFPAGFDLEAVEAVCTEAAGPAGEVLEVFSSLVEKSWVMMEPHGSEARYRLLEIVRQYALERLRASGQEGALRARHAEYFLTLVEGAEPGMMAFGATAEGVRRFEVEAANLRAAADWFQRHPAGATAGLRLVCGLYWPWHDLGLYRELDHRLTAALQRPDATPSSLRGRGLTALGFTAFAQGDTARMRRLLGEAEAFLRGEDDPAALVHALIGRALAESLAGAPEVADPLLDEALALGRTHGLTLFTALGLYWRGGLAWTDGRLEAGRVALGEALRLVGCCGNPAAVAHASIRCGILAMTHGDPDTAEGCFAEALAADPVVRHRSGAVQILLGLAGVALARGQAERAMRLIGAAEAESSAMEAPLRPDLIPIRDELICRAERILGSDRVASERAAGRGLSRDEALALGGEVPSRSRQGDPPEAATPALRVPVLEVRSLGPLEILRDGVPVPIQAWRAARPRELLLYLLCHREGATRDQLGLVFWPDAAPAQIKNGFHVALHHVRRALGLTDLIRFERDRYRVSWELGIEFDAERFAVEAAAAGRLEGPEAVARLQDALTRYRGEFLEDAGAGDWHLEHRAHLRRLCLDALLRLGRELERADNPLEAARAYGRILALDPAHEEACRRLMRCHVLLGDRGEALRQYDRLVAVLRADFEADPEPATRVIYERIRSGIAV